MIQYRNGSGQIFILKFGRIYIRQQPKAHFFVCFNQHKIATKTILRHATYVGEVFLSKNSLHEQQSVQGRVALTHVLRLYVCKFPTVYDGGVFDIDDFMIHQKPNEHPVNYLQIENLIDSKNP